MRSTPYLQISTRMLLTSSQVSVAISSFIVFIFTSALFLSGYVLQQQTVRDLRAAIKPQLVRPKPGPDLYLPPQFRDADYWEARGVVDAVRIQEPEGVEDEIGTVTVNGEEKDDMIGATRWQKAARRKKKLMEEQALKEGQKVLGEGKSGDEKLEEQDVEPKEPEKPVSRAERRRKIKEQILYEGEGESFKGYRRRVW